MLSNMCKLIFLVLFLHACASQKNTKEYIIDTKYNQAVGGYKKGTLFEINREYWYKDYISDSLTVETDIFPNVDRKTSKLYRIDFNGNNNHRYTTSKGIKVGDSSQKVEKIKNDIDGMPISNFPRWNHKNQLIQKRLSSFLLNDYLINEKQIRSSFPDSKIHKFVEQNRHKLERDWLVLVFWNMKDEGKKS